MFTHRLDEFPPPSILVHWGIMIFNAGFINAGGYLATGQFVSHVTGFATLFGVNLANQQIHMAIGMLSVPFFFLLGSFLAGLLIERQIYLHKKPHFDVIIGLSGFCLLIAAIAGEAAHFGDFGEIIRLKKIYLLLILLSLACGLQNAAITTSSGSSIRTTHLTGLVTDLGLGFARLLTISRKSTTFHKEASINWFRTGSILVFMTGSAIGAWLFATLGYRGFLLSSLISFYITWQGRRIAKFLK